MQSIPTKNLLDLFITKYFHMFIFMAKVPTKSSWQQDSSDLWWSELLQADIRQKHLEECPKATHTENGRNSKLGYVLCFKKRTLLKLSMKVINENTIKKMRTCRFRAQPMEGTHTCDTQQCMPTSFMDLNRPLLLPKSSIHSLAWRWEKCVPFIEWQLLTQSMLPQTLTTFIQASISESSNDGAQLRRWIWQR